MICVACRNPEHHSKCFGGNWCDCQHGGKPLPPPDPTLRRFTIDELNGIAPDWTGAKTVDEYVRSQRDD